MDPNIRPRSGMTREWKWVSRAERIWQGGPISLRGLGSQLGLEERMKEGTGID